MSDKNRSLRLERQQKDDTLKRLAMQGSLGLGAVGVTTVAMAAPIDVSSTVTEIEGNKEPMVSIGTAVLGLIVVALLFMMVRRVLR